MPVAAAAAAAASHPIRGSGTEEYKQPPGVMPQPHSTFLMPLLLSHDDLSDDCIMFDVVCVIQKDDCTMSHV